jgi:hypothetical protein
MLADVDLPMPLQTLAAEQSGVVTRRQLLQHGVSIGQIRWHVGRSWRVFLPGVIVLAPAVPTVAQRHVAALLFAGSESWLAGTTAASLLVSCPTTPSLASTCSCHRPRNLARSTG